MPGLSGGMMTEFLQISGIIQLAIERLYIVVKILPIDPRCFRCRLEMLSCPTALEAIQALLASAVCCGVKELGLSRLLIPLDTSLDVGEVT